MYVSLPWPCRPLDRLFCKQSWKPRLSCVHPWATGFARSPCQPLVPHISCRMLLSKPVIRRPPADGQWPKNKLILRLMELLFHLSLAATSGPWILQCMPPGHHRTFGCLQRDGLVRTLTALWWSPMILSQMHRLGKLLWCTGSPVTQ